MLKVYVFTRMWSVCCSNFSEEEQRRRFTWKLWVKFCGSHRLNFPLSSMKSFFKSLSAIDMSQKHMYLCVQTVFLCPFRQENSMHLLVGLLTGSDAQCRLLAVRCLHELSYSPNTSVASACMPATPYLLTFLSGPTTKFTVSACRIIPANHLCNHWTFSVHRRRVSTLLGIYVQSARL